MIFRQHFELETSTYSYLLGCERTRRACLKALPANQSCGLAEEPL